MDDERLFDEDLTADEVAALKENSEPVTIVHSKDEYVRALQSAIVRAQASWTEAAVLPGNTGNQAASAPLHDVHMTGLSADLTSEPRTAQYA